MELSSHFLTETLSGQDEGTEQCEKVQFIDKQSAWNMFLTPDKVRGNLSWPLAKTEQDFYNPEKTQWQTDASKVTRAVSDSPVLPFPALSYQPASWPLWLKMHFCHGKSQLNSIGLRCNVPNTTSKRTVLPVELGNCSSKQAWMRTRVTCAHGFSCRLPGSALGSCIGRSPSQPQVAENCLLCKAAGNKAHGAEPSQLNNAAGTSGDSLRKLQERELLTHCSKNKSQCRQRLCLFSSPY